MGRGMDGGKAGGARTASAGNGSSGCRVRYAGSRLDVASPLIPSPRVCEREDDSGDGGADRSCDVESGDVCMEVVKAGRKEGARMSAGWVE